MSQNITKPTILVADDDHDDRSIMGDTFREMGHEDKVKMMEDGIELLAYLRDIGCDAVKLIILDLNMPLLNGTEVLRLLKENVYCKPIPVVIFSTSLNPVERDKCLSLGAKEYITKPDTYAEYIAACQTLYNMAAR